MILKNTSQLVPFVQKNSLQIISHLFIKDKKGLLALYALVLPFDYSKKSN